MKSSVALSFTVPSFSAIRAMTETTAAISQQMETALKPLRLQVEQMTETLRRAQRIITESAYVKAKKTKARLVAFLLSLLVRLRRSTITNTPTSWGVAFHVLTVTNLKPPSSVSVLATHRGGNAPNLATSYITRTATSGEALAIMATHKRTEVK